MGVTRRVEATLDLNKYDILLFLLFVRDNGRGTEFTQDAFLVAAKKNKYMLLKKVCIMPRLARVFYWVNYEGFPYRHNNLVITITIKDL